MEKINEPKSWLSETINKTYDSSQPNQEKKREDINC